VECGSWDVFAAVLGEDKESVLGGRKQQIGVQCVQPRGRGSPIEVENRTTSPAGKNGQNKSRVDSTADANQFQVLRELLGDYPSSNDNSVGGHIVIPESVF